MIQQVNLYPESEQRQEITTVLPFLVMQVLVLLGLSVIGGMQWHALYDLEKRQVDLQRQLQVATAEVLRLQAQTPDSQHLAVLEQELQQSQKLLHNLSHIVEILADDRSDQTQGFSRYLQTLAMQATSDVWVSRISIDSPNASFSLYGSSFSPQAIPELLKRLQDTEVFKNLRFARMQIKQSADMTGQVDFIVSSGNDVESKNAH